MIYIEGPHFKDKTGRILMLRGVNLGGSSKMPYTPRIASHIDKNFFENRNISFINRPFPLNEADSHFKRLKSWGFECIRLIVTWEAIEPQEPGKYDTQYLDYLHQLIQKGQEHSLYFFIDFHQDVWSRFSGGDGAPRWTFEAVGLDVTEFSETGAAIVHNTHRGQYPKMIWATNYAKLASATMFTLFFGGNDFAPATKVNQIPVQVFLQNHYFNAVKKVAQHLKDLENVIGYDAMNEPSPGWIGWKDLNSNDFMLRKGLSPTPYQAMIAGAGHTVTIEKWQTGWMGSKKTGKVQINPKGVKTWLNGHKCIWKENGVWGINKLYEPELLKPNHFSEVNGKAVDFSIDYLLPFINRFAKEIRSVAPSAVIFMEPPVNEDPPQLSAKDAKKLVHAPHWYDVATLFTQRFFSWMAYDLRKKKVIFGKNTIQRAFNKHLAEIKHQGIDLMGGAPTLIGETGIPFNINSNAFIKNNFSIQVKALDRTLKALEANLLNYTIWNYTADNNEEYGDQWNGENLSIFSKEQQKNQSDINSGGRALKALLRPYPMKIAGVPLKINFDIKRLSFEFEFQANHSIREATEIYVPNYQYPNGYKVEVSSGKFEIDTEKQRLYFWHDKEKNMHTIKIFKQ